MADQPRQRQVLECASGWKRQRAASIIAERAMPINKQFMYG
jgi:hypothetical protein